MSDCLNKNDLFSHAQSVYRPKHSTETFLLKVMNDLLLAVDRGWVSPDALEFIGCILYNRP